MELWEIKYEPKTWQDLLIPDVPQVKILIEQLFTTGSLPARGIILHGEGGSGKTTLVNLFDMYSGWPVVKIDPAGESKRAIDDLKEQLNRTFTSLIDSPYGFAKILVIGNEISKSSIDFREGLRDILDTYHKLAFFIFTDNNYGKLCLENPQMWNNQRIRGLNWNLIDKNTVEEYCLNILKKEGLFTAVNIAQTKSIVEQYHPSIRAILGEMQIYCH